MTRRGALGMPGISPPVKKCPSDAQSCVRCCCFHLDVEESIVRASVPLPVSKIEESSVQTLTIQLTTLPSSSSGLCQVIPSLSYLVVCLRTSTSLFGRRCLCSAAYNSFAHPMCLESSKYVRYCREDVTSTRYVPSLSLPAGDFNALKLG